MRKHIVLLAVVLALVAMPAISEQPAPRPTAKVFLAASGTAEQLPTVLDGITDCLSVKGVTTKQISSEPMSRAIAVDKLRQEGGLYLLFLNLDFAPGKNVRASLTMQCLNSDGKLLWEEEAKGGMAMFSQSSYIKKMIKKACSLLDAHVGKEGLPTDVQTKS
jgi:hypothetical protein